MPKKRVKAKFYESGFVGKDIIAKSKEMVTSDTEVAWTEADAYSESRYRNPKRDIARDEYMRLGLNYYADKEAMRESLSEYDKGFWKKHNLDQFWNEYLARDRLIAAGLYDKAKQEVYAENYLTQAAMYIGGDDGVLKEIGINLKKLTTEQFTALTKPQADRDKITTALPPIQEFYGLSRVVSDKEFYEDILSRFKQAFKEADIPWETIKDEEEEEPAMTNPKYDYDYDDGEPFNQQRYDELVEEIEQSYSKSIKVNVSSSIYGKTLKQAFKSSPKKTRQTIAIGANPRPSDIFDERKEALRALHIKERHLLEQGKALVFINKSGQLYIPFVRKDIAKDYLKTYYGK